MRFYNWLLNSVVLPIGDTVLGGNYLKYIKQWQDFDQKNEVELEIIQQNRLKSMLDHAIKNVPYYDKITESDLKSFPILTKSNLRHHAQDLVSKTHQISKLDKHHSSGSSGIQSFTYMTHDHKFFLRALQTHWWTWSGYHIGDPLLQFGISQQRNFVKRLKDLFYRCTYVKAFGLSEEELKETLVKVSNKKNLVVAGYPSVINQLAISSLRENIQPNLKSIICFGDKLFDHYQETMVSAFGKSVKIVDTYGCAEGLLMACKQDLEYYYIMSPHVFIEIVDDNGAPVEDGKMGHVLVTSLTNKAMPLIRYQLGDLAIKLPKELYPKHRLKQYPLLQKVVGRETDIVKTTKGITLNVHSFTGVLEYFQDIKQYKIIQNNLNNIIIEYIVDEASRFNPSVLETIKHKLNTLTHHSLEITFRKVQVIKPTKSGKPQIIESNIV
ncbi:hypothetical protein [Psychroserpens mesophilus]|uniref:hypothetical protein n=1 Tax=Psychroserpens mesophilus TaxID=325473 RepID=UPI003D65A9EC